MGGSRELPMQRLIHNVLPPEVTVARQGDLFQKQCFLEADSPLPAVRLPQSGW